MEHSVWSKVDTRQVRRQMLFVLADAPPALTAGCDTSFAFRQETPCQRALVAAVVLCHSSGHTLTRGGPVAAVIQSQSGNSVNIAMTNSTRNGVPNSVSPDVTGLTRTRVPTGETGSSRQIQVAARLTL